MREMLLFEPQLLNLLVILADLVDLLYEVSCCLLEGLLERVDRVLGYHVNLLHVIEHYKSLVVETFDTVTVFSEFISLLLVVFEDELVLQLGLLLINFHRDRVIFCRFFFFSVGAFVQADFVVLFRLVQSLNSRGPEKVDGLSDVTHVPSEGLSKHEAVQTMELFENLIKHEGLADDKSL